MKTCVSLLIKRINFNRNCKGYTWNKQKQKWRAYITVNGKQKHLGYFDLEEDAKNARLAAKKIYSTLFQIENNF